MPISKIKTSSITADATSVSLNIDAGTLYLDAAANNVGINTTSPSEKVHINNSSDASIRISTTASGGKSYNITTGGNGNYSPGVFAIRNVTDATTPFAIYNSKVGIGTTNPAYNLDVSSTTLPAAKVSSSYTAGNKIYSSLLLGSASNNNGASFGFVYDSNSPTSSYAHITPFGNTESTALTVTAGAGNVGIGVSSANTKLDIQAVNPANGLLSVLRNNATTGWTGAQLWFVQSNIEDWTIGCPAGDYGFGIWSGRNQNNDGTQILKLTRNVSNTNSGWLGLGVDPVMPVHIKKDWVNGYATLGIQAATTGASTGVGLFNAAGARNAYFSYDTNALSLNVGNQSNGNIVFSTNDTGRVWIGNAGGVGIGIADPQSALEINGSLSFTSTVSPHGAYAALYIAQAYNGQKYVLHDNGAFGRFDIRTPKPADFLRGYMQFGFTSYNLDSTATYADMIQMASYTDSSGGDNNAMLFNKNGSGVKIVRTGWDAYGQLANTNMSGGTIYTLNYTSASDQTVKEEVTNISNGLSVINQLRPVTFKWTDEYIKAGLSKNRNEQNWDKETNSVTPPAIEDKTINVGLIAQEVEQVLPTVVMNDNISLPGKEEYLKNIMYEKLVPHLIAAVQELSAKVDAQAELIAQLQTK